MFSRFRPLLTTALAVTLQFSGGCARTPDVPPASAPAATKTIEDRFAIKVGDRTVQMQLALRIDEMQRGLMFRQSMPEDQGMIFVYAQPTQMSFWMRNCDLPLDIGFFDGNGELKEIYPMYPHDERSVMSRAKDLRFALEMNQGWYERNGVQPGARLDLKALAEGVRARGFKPAEFGLQ